MGSRLLSPCSVVVLMLLISSGTHVHCSFVVTNYGATGNGQTDDKQGFMAAWEKACATNGGTMEIPEGTYLVSGAVFLGPCNGQTNVILSGTVKAPPAPQPGLDYWIMFQNIGSLSVEGKGTLNGNGASYWRLPQRPTISSLKFEHVSNARIQGLNSVDSKMFHIGVHNCQNVALSKINIVAPYNSPNTDGIHISLSNFVSVVDSNIATGDDCISLGDGATNINITRVNCGPGHGLSIGSLGRYAGEKDVSTVTVTNCTLTRTTNGVRIKTVAPSPPSTASGITFQHIVMNNVQNPIIIDQHYCAQKGCNKEAESEVSIKQVKFIDVHGSSQTADAIKISCSKGTPCQDIELSGVNLHFQGKPTTASCSNADVRFIASGQVPAACS